MAPNQPSLYSNSPSQLQGTQKKKKNTISINYNPPEEVDLRIFFVKKSLYPKERGPISPDGSFRYICHVVSARPNSMGSVSAFLVRPIYRENMIEVPVSDIFNEIRLNEIIKKNNQRIFQGKILHIVNPPWCISSANMTRIYLKESHEFTTYRQKRGMEGQRIITVHVKATDGQQINKLLDKINDRSQPYENKNVAAEVNFLKEKERKKAFRIEDPSQAAMAQSRGFLPIGIDKDDLEKTLTACWETGVDLDPLQLDFNKFGISLLSRGQTRCSELEWKGMVDDFLSNHVGESQMKELTEDDWLNTILPGLIAPFRYQVHVDLIGRKILPPYSVTSIGQVAYRLSAVQALQFLDCAHLKHQIATSCDLSEVKDDLEWLTSFEKFWGPIGIKAGIKRIYRTTGIHASSLADAGKEMTCKRRNFKNPRPLNPQARTRSLSSSDNEDCSSSEENLEIETQKAQKRVKRGKDSVSPVKKQKNSQSVPTFEKFTTTESITRVTNINPDNDLNFSNFNFNELNKANNSFTHYNNPNGFNNYGTWSNADPNENFLAGIISSLAHRNAKSSELPFQLLSQQGSY